MKPNLSKIKKMKSTKELLEFGIINIDKSSGPTSFQVSEFVKKQFDARKTSHFGTLDPRVTGVLPVAINRACKLAGYFLGEDKTYVGIMRIHEDIELEKIQEKINEKFLGEIIQMPPVKSRVKRQLRPRTIYEFKILEKQGKDILFRVKCQGGTYVRTLCVDLGEELGIGAHMLELRRTNAAIFFEDDLEYPVISLYDFEKTAPERNILRENAKTINFELWDAIDKEITLMLSDIQLNNIPFTNTALKREMQTIFARHSARLASQVTTETTRATNQGIKWGYDKSGLVSHKQWAAIIDGKTSQICLDLNGEIREIGKAFSSGDYGPPAHVNCRSRIVKVTLTSKKE